jgi:hypothetical protein
VGGLHAATSVAVAAVLVITTAAPAAADTVSFRDNRGDAPARYDLTRVKVINGQDDVVVTTRVRNLRGDRTQILGFGLTVAGDEGSYTLHTVRRASGNVTAKLWRYDSDGQTEVACNTRAKWRPAKDIIRVSVAQGCLEMQGGVRVNLYIGAGDGTAGDPVDWTKTVRVAHD